MARPARICANMVRVMVSDAHFDTLVAQAFAAVPREFRDACAGLAIRVEPEAGLDVLGALEIDDPFALLGLYHGVALTQKSVMDVRRSPDEVVLYREPIKAYAVREGHALKDVVFHVLVHEIGHHFGFSDDDMERLQSSSPIQYATNDD